jgi:hypothetical protein
MSNDKEKERGSPRGRRKGKSRGTGMTATKAAVLEKIFGPPHWALTIPDEIYVLEGYDSLYTHRMPEHNTVAVFSEEQLARDFVEALEDGEYRPRRMDRDDLRDRVIRDMPVVSALMLLDIPERPVMMQIRFE